MAYSKYFSNGQKVFLKRIFTEEERDSIDSMTAYAMSGTADTLDLSLPYGSDAAEAYPFEEGMMFELLTDHNSMGLCLKASFVEKTSQKDIRLRYEGCLQFISRRMYRRVDVNAWVGVERTGQGLADMRTKWQQALEKLNEGVSAADLTKFEKVPVNLAGGGLRLPIDESTEPADLLLLFLSIGDKQGIICALAEVVWSGYADDQGRIPTGMRFVNILKRDQDRIDAVVEGVIERLSG